jgi:protocatechuate 3,4-dioxygenase beta subunit
MTKLPNESRTHRSSLCAREPGWMSEAVLNPLLANSDLTPKVFTITRRRFVRTTGLAAGFFVVPGAFAEELTRAVLRRTAWVMEGPFYPEKLPLDSDNDLIIVNDSITPAVGEITHVAGRIRDARGDPIKNAVVEIWQVDHNAIYLAERDAKRTGFDPNFQGFGRFQTGSSGEYRFRTIKPVVYPGRLAPHIHFKIKAPGRDPWTTQLYIKGFPNNQRDGIYRGIGDAKAQESVTMEFAPMKDSRIGELTAKFDIVLSFTAMG